MSMNYTLGSLFDGSGGFPLAGSMCGFTPLWAAEVEPYPIAVTRSRFPEMRHLGDISKINGAKIPPVDVITFGSPCQDLSVAGKRAGLKHEGNGDEETTRSGLFMEAVRIIKEMREATHGRYPNFALWENVPGAFSSNGGEDFRLVLQELIQIVEPCATVPPAPKGGWPYADAYMGGGWSLAYRVFDAQYWGVPQRRRRIHLVVDFGGERAREILFEREGVRGYFAEGRSPWQGIAADAESGIGADDLVGNGADGHPCVGVCGGVGVTAFHLLQDPITSEKVSPCLCQGNSDGGQASVGIAIKIWDARGNGDGDTVSTLTGDHENRITDYTSVVVEPASFYPQMKAESQCFRTDGVANTIVVGTNPGFHNGVVQPVVAIDRAAFKQGQNAQYDPQFYTDGTVSTLVARGPSAVAYSETYQKVTGPLMANSHPGSYTGQDAYNDMLIVGKEKIRYIVRRLTPIECARLQGFADRWGDIEEKADFTDEEWTFWAGVRNTHAAINGKAVKSYTKAQMLTWYNKLHTDSAEYKMWGNGIALPPALYCMQGIEDALSEVRGDG